DALRRAPTLAATAGLVLLDDGACGDFGLKDADHEDFLGAYVVGDELDVVRRALAGLEGVLIAAQRSVSVDGDADHNGIVGDDRRAARTECDDVDHTVVGLARRKGQDILAADIDLKASIAIEAAPLHGEIGRCGDRTERARGLDFEGPVGDGAGTNVLDESLGSGVEIENELILEVLRISEGECAASTAREIAVDGVS